MLQSSDTISQTNATFVFSRTPNCRINKPQIYSGQVTRQLWDWLQPCQIRSVLSLYKVSVCVCVCVCVGIGRVFVSHFASRENDASHIIGGCEARHVSAPNYFITLESNCPNRRWMSWFVATQSVCVRSCVYAHVCVCVCVCAQVLVAGASMHARAKMHVFLEWLGWQYKSIWLHNESRNNAHLTDVKYSTRPLNWTRWRTTVLPSWMKGQKFVFQRCM